jgi:hypothetical protein
MRLSTSVCVALFTLALILAAMAQVRGPELSVQGRVNGNTLTSSELPGVSLDFAKSLTYAGGQRFTLYDVAEAEQHFFVETGPQESIRRFYWIQFEHYLPTNDHQYKYKADRVAKLGDVEFITDTRVFANYAGIESNPASDSAKMRAFFRSKGYRLPDGLARARCFYLPDSSRRSELMIIYGETLTQADLGAAIPAEESADVKYPEVAARVIAHMGQGVTIRRR